MQGLKLTYETLATTRNEAAVDVLIAALDDSNSSSRRAALTALLARSEKRCPGLVLDSWDKLGPDDVRVLRQKKKWMGEAVEAALKQSGDSVVTAIAAAQALELTTTLPQIILLAESCASHQIQQRAVEAVLTMVAPLGANARADRDQPTVRGPVLARLADSVRRFSMHRNEKMVEAFLQVATWGDGDLRQLLAQEGPELDLVCNCFAEAEHPAVIELLAGFIRRRNIPDRIGQIIQRRADAPFRDALLRKIGSEPTATVLRNIREIGMPVCVQGGEELLKELAPDYRSPLLHIYVTANQDCQETLHLIAATLERGGPGCDSAAAIALSRVEVPEIDFWMRAAVPVADGDESVIAKDDNARLLKRLIDLLDHADKGVVRGVRQVLGPLHADEMLSRFGSLRPRSRRRLGRVVMMIDPDAIQRARDALRHPVLSNRLEAIALADALAAVDLLADSFQHIAREDHQEARMRAAEAMADASGSQTLQLLQEMTDLPECPVRDVAIQALQRRQDHKSAKAPTPAS